MKISSRNEILHAFYDEYENEKLLDLHKDKNVEIKFIS